MTEGIFSELDETYGGNGDYVLHCAVVEEGVEIVVVADDDEADSESPTALSGTVKCAKREAADVCTAVYEHTDYGYAQQGSKEYDGPEDLTSGERLENIIRALIEAALDKTGSDGDDGESGDEEESQPEEEE